MIRDAVIKYASEPLFDTYSHSTGYREGNCLRRLRTDRADECLLIGVERT